MHHHALIHLAWPVSFPALGRRTGTVCRVVTGRKLLFAAKRDGSAELVGLLDGQGKLHRSAVDTVTHLQAGAVIAGELLDGRHGLVPAFRALASGRGLGGPGFYRFASFSALEAVENIAAWPAGGPEGVTVMMRPVAGFLSSPDDALPGPWRQSGVLWPNGKFARPSCTCTISTVRQRGIVIAGILPLALCEEHRKRMEGRWPGWEPEAPGESAVVAARNIARIARPRRYERVCFDLLRDYALSKPSFPGNEHKRIDFVSLAASKPVIWRGVGGVSRMDHQVRQFFE